MDKAQVFPVGHISRENERTYLEIIESYVPALKQMEHFSHVLVFWWAGAFQRDAHRAACQVQPPYENAPVSGVFASRSPARPNPIGLTTVEVLNVDHRQGVIEIAGIDAYDGTPVLDIKPHIPVEDRVKDARVSGWMSNWPEWIPERGYRPEEQAISVNDEADALEVSPVGYIRHAGGRASLHIEESYIPALKNLESFSHVRMLWWFHRFDDARFRRATHNKPPYENAPVTGVFASRSPVRPNPIGLTTAQIVGIDHEHGIVDIGGTDAFEGTPILDLKPYIPANDRVKHFRVPEWIAHWPVWHQGFEQPAAASADSLLPADSDRLSEFQLQQPELSPSLPHSHTPNEVTATGNADAILIRGARQHNLKNIDLAIPRNNLTVITGVSGSGKSSLAFDTLYVEGRRRYVGSLSTLARRLVGQMEKPQVDHILGLAPTIAIEQGSVSRNPRSTVGTVTEVQDYLRVLFARAGTRHCTQCGRAIKPQTARRIAEQLAVLVPGTRFQLLAPVVRRREGAHAEILERLHAGNAPVRIDGEMIDTEMPRVALDETVPHTIERVMGDFEVPDDSRDAFLDHLLDAVETGLKAGNGYLIVILEDGEELMLTQHLVCPHCDIFFFELSPALFSFNNPDGMCSDCSGLGVKLDVDPEMVIAEPGKSLLDGASPWYGELRKVEPSGNWMRSELFALADHMQVDLELPWQELPEAFRHAALYGTGDEIISWTYDMKKRGRSISFERPVAGAVNNIKRLLQQTQSEDIRQRFLGFMRKQPCPTCGGERLGPEGRLVTVGGTRFPDVASMTLGQAHEWVAGLRQRLTAEQYRIAGEIIDELEGRLESLLNVGLHYLALDRPAPTLSGGEGQRIRLATQLGCGLTGLLYVLDEPSIGLHPRDHQALLDMLARLRDAGNTIVVVEHDEDTMRAADWLIDIGPGAGALGGELVAAGTPGAVMANPASLTGQYLSGELQVKSPNGKERREAKGWLTLAGARLHNLKAVDARFPLGLMTCVTGVSGSGKSSLVTQTLSPALACVLQGAEEEPGPHDRIDGLDRVDKVINVDQSPIGRTPRSNPVTYVGAFDEIRKVFAQTSEARKRGYKVQRFSFNAKDGRCEACEGHGRRRIEMHFLPDVWVTCSECKGKRFNRQTLEIEYRGKFIADVLDMDIEEALTFFADRAKLAHILQTLHDVGLGYLKLGQSALTLSGGEAQRVKLARELCRPDTGHTVYILDEPTTGLHFADIQKLLDVLHRLTDAGNTVIVIEHNLDVIKAADWVIDLGPEGGDEGGYIVSQGTPEQVALSERGYTGRFLRKVLEGEK
ncbi:MAG: excinuclease ABC subunit UvrA [Anaerolineae bacterium]|nr:excinuclease ABC subunit UvrA [Anaerolineae bacterium]